MKKVVAKVNFIANGIPYIKGDEIEGLSIEQIKKLNEQKLIQPLSYEDLVIMERQMKKEEEL